MLSARFHRDLIEKGGQLDRVSREALPTHVMIRYVIAMGPYMPGIGGLIIGDECTVGVLRKVYRQGDFELAG